MRRVGDSKGDTVSSPAQKEVERKLAKLRKRGVIDENNAVKAPKLKSRTIAADPVRTAMFTKDATATVLGTAQGYNIMRAGVGSLKTAAAHQSSLEMAPLGGVLGGAGAGLGVITYGVGLGINAAKLDNTLNTERSKAEAAAKDADQALKYVQTQGKEGSAEAYFRFIKATEPIIAPAGGRSSTSLDKQVYGGNIVRYLSNMGSAVTGLANAATKLTTGALLIGASVASGVLSIIASGAEIIVTAAQRKKVDAELQASHTHRKNLREWIKAGRKEALDKGLHKAFDAEARRREKMARRAAVNNEVSLLKGMLGMAAGIAFVVVGAVATAATAGLVLPILAGTMTAVCLTASVVQLTRESKVAKLAKREQRQAEALMATHKVSELKKLLRSEDAQARKRQVATVVRKHWWSSEKAGRMRTVDIGKNGYLARQIMAYDLAAEIQASEQNKLDNAGLFAALTLACEKPASAEVQSRFQPELLRMIKLMKANGKGDTEIVAICQQAFGMSDPSACRSFLREQLADAMGAPWVKEKATVPAKAYLGPLQALLDRERKAGREPDMRSIAREFRNTLGKVNYPKFVQAVREDLKPTGKAESELVWMARSIELYEALDADPAAAVASASQQSAASETAKKNPQLASKFLKASVTGESVWEMPELPTIPSTPQSGHSRSQSLAALEESQTEGSSKTIASLDSSNDLESLAPVAAVPGQPSVSSTDTPRKSANSSSAAIAARTRVPRSPRAPRVGGRGA